MTAVSRRSLRWSNATVFDLMVIVNGFAGNTALIGEQGKAYVSDANHTLTTSA